MDEVPCLSLPLDACILPEEKPESAGKRGNPEQGGSHFWAICCEQIARQDYTKAKEKRRSRETDK